LTVSKHHFPGRTSDFAERAEILQGVKRICLQKLFSWKFLFKSGVQQKLEGVSYSL